jgi:tetratricopeptide (TPR) repeat protein
MVKTFGINVDCTNYRSLSVSYNNIGDLQRSMGHYSLALENLEKVLNIRLKKYSPHDSSLAIIYNNIDLIHHELGDYTKA